MDLLSTLSGIWNVIMEFLGGFLDTNYFLPVVICFIIASAFNPHGPTKANQLTVSFIFGAIGAYLLVLLFRGTSTDASILALIVLAVGLVWLFTKSEGWIGKIVIGILAILSIGAVITVSTSNPTGGLFPQAVSTIWTTAQSILDTLI